MTTTNTGILTDKGMNDDGVMIARIDDTPYPVLPYVLPFLEKCMKGNTVEYLLKDGKIGKIAPVRAPSGPTATGGTSETCTSPKASPAAPANGLKKVEGQIVFLDVPAHKISIKTRDGNTYTFVWPPGVDGEFSRLQQWWFTGVTGELVEKDPEMWKATGLSRFDRPADWPFAKGGGGKGGFRQFQPRNEKPIVYQCAYKEACETIRRMVPMLEEFDEEKYQHYMDIALARGLKDGKALIDASGV